MPPPICNRGTLAAEGEAGTDRRAIHPRTSLHASSRFHSGSASRSPGPPSICGIPLPEACGANRRTSHDAEAAADCANRQRHRQPPPARRPSHGVAPALTVLERQPTGRRDASRPARKHDQHRLAARYAAASHLSPALSPELSLAAGCTPPSDPALDPARFKAELGLLVRQIQRLAARVTGPALACAAAHHGHRASSSAAEIRDAASLGSNSVPPPRRAASWRGQTPRTSRCTARRAGFSAMHRTAVSNCSPFILGHRQVAGEHEVDLPAVRPGTPPAPFPRKAVVCDAHPVAEPFEHLSARCRPPPGRHPHHEEDFFAPSRPRRHRPPRAASLPHRPPENKGEKARAAAGMRVERHRLAVLLHDAMHHGQPEHPVPSPGALVV